MRLTRRGKKLWVGGEGTCRLQAKEKRGIPRGKKGVVVPAQEKDGEPSREKLAERTVVSDPKALENPNKDGRNTDSHCLGVRGS